MILGLATNLFRLFRENSDVVPVSRLKKQGVRSVTVLDWSRIETLIATAVDEALARRGVDLSKEALASVNQEAREAFARLVEQRDTYRDSALTLEQEKTELAENLRLLRQELVESTGALAREKEHTVSVADVGVDEQSMETYRRRLEAEVRRLLENGARPAESADATALSISELARRLLDDERNKALRAARSEQQHRIQQLERRIGKLTRSLTETESMVERLRQLKDGDEGIESIYREVQGLDPSDPNAVDKRGLLEEIFKLNVELRDVIRETRAAAEEDQL